MSKKRKPTGRRFSEEAKAEAVALLERGDVTQEQLAAELGVTSRTLQNWRRQLQEAEEATPLTAEERRRLKRLTAENKRLKMELEILKKARTFSAKRRS
jgi:transposase